ncbi:MAG TPA: PrgI family protein, partial [Patescibacteria group bacterium]|nr:PrgI family protein [Patescibacteria group bacterium]
MDNHPIPQDVTGFQFRLIGDMTIKQFAYLTAGVVLAWICLSLPVLFFLKLPLVVFFGGTGVIFAFIPIAGRPADT